MNTASLNVYKYLGLTVLAVSMVVLGSLQVAQAAPPVANKPLTLVDGSGTLLGNIIAVDSDTLPSSLTYNVYNAGLNGILQYEIYGIGVDGAARLKIQLSTLYFAQLNCLGPAFSDEVELFQPQWILGAIDGNFYKKSGPLTGTAPVSRFNSDTTCTNDDFSGVGTYPLSKITLPSTFTNPTIPFTISQ